MTTMASGTLIGMMPRTPYMVEGESVASGSDGEPLRSNGRKVAILSYDREKKVLCQVATDATQSNVQ